MTEINLSLGRLFRIWWAIQWRSALVIILFSAICYFLWQAFPWPMLFSAWATEELVYGIAALAAAVIAVPFGLLTVRWFLYSAFADLQSVLDTPEASEPPQFRIEPRIGNIAHDSFRTKAIPLDRVVDAASQVTARNSQAEPKTQNEQLESNLQSGFA